MDLRYIMYDNPEKKYYSPPIEKVKRTAYKMPKLEEGWLTELDEYSHWRYYMYSGNILPDQGWKIHISAPIYAAQKILDLCAAFLIENKIDFKYVDNRWELFLKNSKYGDRGGAGKFITIYPADDNVFKYAILELEKILKDTPNGPYILSDKCWKDSNIYFRYGGIKPIYAELSGSRVLAIKNINGEYMEDAREPYYNLPEFVTEPDFIRKMDVELNESEDEKSNLDIFEITGAIHFSDAGGMYTANNKSNGKKVILKEGRPEAGLDGNYKDAVSRIYHEALMLDKMKDIPEVVEYYGIFNEWKHVFLVEEFVNGVNFNSWCTIRFPFQYNLDKEKEYCQNTCKILKNTIRAIKAMHNRNIGMGDLQPMNIMVNEDDFSIRLIDFEAADDLKSKSMPALVTPGFATEKAKTRLQGDWYSLLCIARNAFLPIGPVQDLDRGILVKHDEWILRNFGDEALGIVKEIEKEMRQHLRLKRKQQMEGLYETFWDFEDIPLVINKIRKGMLNDLNVSEILLGGDIRQFEEQGGKINVKTGGFGIALALKRSGDIPFVVKEWVNQYRKKEYLEMMNDGLYSGRTGVACVLYELGYIEDAEKILESVEISSDASNVSLMSGLSGIGIAILSFLQKKENKNLVEKLEKISTKLYELMEQDTPLVIEDPDDVAVGLFNGWSGVSLFYLLRYRVEKENKWLQLSIQALEKDIRKCIFDDSGVFHVDDDKRFFPYLDGGSLGIGMVLLEIKRHLTDEYLEEEVIGLNKQIDTRCCYNAGLFHGYAGFIAYANSSIIAGLVGKEKVDNLLYNLNIYLIETNDAIYCPGNYSYKFSGDIFSGAAGVLLTLQDLYNKSKFSWLPIIDVNYFFRGGI